MALASSGAAAQNVPKPRTITAQIKPKALARTVDILFFRDGRTCTDSFTLSASRREIHPGEPVTFRSSISRKCNGQAAKAPVPASVSFTVRSTAKKSKAAAQTVQPTGTVSSFAHTFERTGAYQVTAVHTMNDVETHTITMTVQVVPMQAHAPAPEN